ncbi:MAG: hypothetical protein MJ182_03595 [Treponema sp.]|nr:hypothetical protein [Treponema sp.]
MNSGQRTAVSLLVTAALFTGFVFSVYSSVFSKIEAKFYEPERISVERERLSQSADFCNNYIQNILEKTAAYATSPVVNSYFSQTPTESEVTERVNLSGELFASLPALDGFRLLDKNGRNLHYSSYSADIVKQNGTTRIYKNYPDISALQGESDFSLVSIPDSQDVPKYKVSFNPDKHFLNISIPVYDNLKLFRGNFVFYFRTLDLERELVKEGFVSLGESVSLLISEDKLHAGILVGLPKIGNELFVKPVMDSWQKKNSGPDKVLETDEDVSWIILSDYSSSYISYSGLYKSDYFELPETARILILVCVFITLFLIMFLLFSIKIDDMVVIRSRIRKIQFALIEEYLNNRESVDWAQVSHQIEGRKDELFRDVKKSLGRKGRKHENQVDALLNKSWEEILSAIGARQDYEKQISYSKDSSSELKKMLEEVLSKSEIKVKAIENHVERIEKTETVEELDEVEEAEAVEELDEVEEAEAVEELDEVEEVEAVEELDEVEEVEAVEEVGEVEEAETVEELDEVEEVEAVEELDEVEEAEAVEEVDEVEEAEAVEELDEVEEAEAVEELVEVEEAETVEEAEVVEVEAVEELDEVEEVEAVEEEDEVEEVETVEELDEVEEAEAVEELGEVEEAETVEELDEVEEIEAVEELDEVEEVDEVEEAETVEELDEVEEAEAIEEVDEVEEAESVEELGEVEEAETVEEVDEVEEVETVEEEDEVEEEEAVEEKDVSGDFVEPVVERDALFLDANSTFKNNSEEEFATVENIFAEELRFGEDYVRTIKHAEDTQVETAVVFDLFNPEFGENEELLPVEEEKSFAMATFGANNNNITDLESENETIVEKEGIYSISETIEVPNKGLDKNFKKLVDAVLR